MSEIFEAIGMLKDFLLFNDGRRKQEFSNRKNAIEGVFRAALETRTYLRYQREGKVTDEQQEVKLRDLWVKAGLELYDIDHVLAERCMLKGAYWADPELWEERNKNLFAINLDIIIEESNNLLKNNQG